MKVRAQVKNISPDPILERSRAIDAWRDAYARSSRPWERAAKAQIAHATPESDSSTDDVHERVAEAAGEVAVLAAQLPEEDPARDRILGIAASSLVIGTFPEHHIKEDTHE